MNKVIPGVVAVVVSFGAGLAGAEEAGKAPAAASPVSTTSTQAEAEPAMQESANPFTAQFMRLDANRDGAIDDKEAKADKSLAKAFGKISKNGKLDEQQYQKWAESRKPKG